MPTLAITVCSRTVSAACSRATRRWKKCRGSRKKTDDSFLPLRRFSFICAAVSECSASEAALMGAYEFTALDDSGKERKGVLEADTPRQIRQQLRDKGWAPLAVVEVRQREERSARRRSLFQPRISAVDLALITRQFATLVRSGLPVEEAVQALSRQTEKSRLKSMMMAVRARVMEGHSLATALADFPHVFPDLYRATVAAGEQSGYLDRVLERLADYTETRQTLQQKTTLALIYPLLVLIVSILVVALLMVYVVPQIVQVFEGIGQKLPPLTRGLIAVSAFTRSYGVYVLIAVVAATVLARMALRKSGPMRWFHHVLLRLPMISRLVRGLNTARFARTLSILTGSSVPVLEALRISASVISYVPPMTLHLIASGEASCKLEEML